MDPQGNDELLHEIHRELKNLTEKVESAFIRDEDGKPDYYGHRMFHKNEQEEKRKFEYSKTKVLRDIVTWISIGALTVVGSLLAQAFLLPQVPSIK